MSEPKKVGPQEHTGYLSFRTALNCILILKLFDVSNVCLVIYVRNLSDGPGWLEGVLGGQLKIFLFYVLFSYFIPIFSMLKCLFSHLSLYIAHLTAC